MPASPHAPVPPLPQLARPSIPARSGDPVPRSLRRVHRHRPPNNRRPPPPPPRRPLPNNSQFFEAKIRPVFVEHCQKCHGPEKQWSGFRLDSREALLKGVKVAKRSFRRPPNSPLVRQIRHEEGEAAMPPKRKLSDLQSPISCGGSRWEHPIPRSIRNPRASAVVTQPLVVSTGQTTGRSKRYRGRFASPIDAFIREKTERRRSGARSHRRQSGADPPA